MITYNFEYERRLRACFIGAGGHSFRNVYPTFQFAPVELVGVCDLQPDRAAAYARIFGGARAYTDHHEMLVTEKPEAVFIVTAYTPDGRVQATDLALDCLGAGAHVWMEKPTAASRAEIESLQSAGAATGLTVMTGLKKVFAPAMAKLKQISTSPEFGRLTSIQVRYPQAVPAAGQRGDLLQRLGLLDHIYHPAAVLTYLGGKPVRMVYLREPLAGATVTTFEFESGAVGALHLAAGQSTTSPLERVEVIGEGANAVVNNGVELTYYRRASFAPYGRAASYIGDEESAPLRWEPEFSLGQLYNKGLFLLGYAPEVIEFCSAVLEGRPPDRGGLDQSLEIMKIYEAYLTAAPGELVTLQ